MIEEFVKASLEQDVGRGDLYALVEPSVEASAKIIAKSDGVLAGVLYCDALAKLESFEIVWNFRDAESFKKGDVVATLSGTSHVLLKIERTLLNMLLHASSIATLTNRYVTIIEPYGTKLLDTRKTRPLLRVFEKYASRCGGAVNHRMGLDDALMIKDTHLKTIKDLTSYIQKARRVIPFTSKIEVEVENFEMIGDVYEGEDSNNNPTACIRIKCCAEGHQVELKAELFNIGDDIDISILNRSNTTEYAVKIERLIKKMRDR